MGLQVKKSTSLDADRAGRLLEMLEAEPLATPSVILALGVDLAYREWLRCNRDLKGLIGGVGGARRPAALVAPARRAG